VGIDGNNLVELVAGGINESPVWTADGRSLVFVSDRAASFGLWSLRVQDGRPAGLITAVRSRTGRVQLHGFGTGGVLYYSRDASLDEIFLASVGREGRITAATESLPGVAPAWSPDGRSLAFKRPLEDGSFELVVRNLDSRQERRWSGTTLNGRPLGNARPVWLGPATLMGGARARVELTGDELKVVTANPAPAVSMGVLGRDGRGVFGLAGAALDNSRSHVGLFDPVTGQEQRSFPVPNGAVTIAVNPAGDLLAVASPDRIGVIRADGSGYQELYSSRALTTAPASIGWSPDGRFVLFVLNEQRTARLMRIASTGGKPEPAGLELGSLRGFDISADGRIAYSTRTQSTEVFSLRSTVLSRN
jgi:Tol biopolymer transport system component